VTMPSGDQWSHSAPDEVVIGWELTRRPDGPRARTGAGLTYFSWQSAYCRTVDNSNAGERTSPCAYVTREAATAACGYAREHGRYFARKIGDGSVASSLQVIGALADCIGFHLLPPPSISPPPSPLPITPPLPWPPTMPLPWPPPMPPPMPPPHRLPSPPLPSEPTLRREQPPQLPTALHNSDGFWYFACFVLAAGLVSCLSFCGRALADASVPQPVVVAAKGQYKERRIARRGATKLVNADADTDGTLCPEWTRPAHVDQPRSLEAIDLVHI